MPRLASAAALAAVIGLGAAPTAVLAQAATETLEIDVTAAVPGRCGFASGAPASAPQDIEKAGRLEVALQLDCNTPFAVGLSAMNGAMVNLDHADDGSGYAFRKSYGVSLDVETDLGSVAGERCDGAQLLAGGSCAYRAEDAGQGLSSGEGVAIDRRLRVIVDWTDQSTRPARLAAGAYHETLRVVIGARV